MVPVPLPFLLPVGGGIPAGVRLARAKGWALAIAGDMLYFAVIAVSTLRLIVYFQNPNTTILVVFGAMMVMLILARSFRPRPSP